MPTTNPTFTGSSWQLAHTGDGKDALVEILDSDNLLDVRWAVAASAPSESIIGAGWPRRNERQLAVKLDTGSNLYVKSPSGRPFKAVLIKP